MVTAEELRDTIIRGMQEKKAFGIATADLQAIETAPARYFVICSGNTPQQVSAIADSVEETVRKEAGEKPAAVVGANNALWVAMDYGTVMVHIFLPDARDHYDLENLWDDSKLTEIPDLD
ncbi:MAG: ribosome silencing factor [Alloprevotella sp.]|nr:ribosome silencing factor [Alloprevotella sp.]MBR1733168.1 ribosome silencing factor [Alloprevotella sp.]